MRRVCEGSITRESSTGRAPSSPRTGGNQSLSRNRIARRRPGKIAPLHQERLTAPKPPSPKARLPKWPWHDGPPSRKKHCPEEPPRLRLSHGRAHASLFSHSAPKPPGAKAYQELNGEGAVGLAGTLRPQPHLLPEQPLQIRQTGRSPVRWRALGF